MIKHVFDLTPVRNKEITFAEFTATLTIDDLRQLTNKMVDTMLALIVDCMDADVTLVPEDPDANDTFAANESERGLSWTLGHVIVHTTASSEETAFIAAELARGVEFHGRSRSELPWRSVTTIEQCRHRLEESRRMRLASFEMWPNEPYLDNTYIPYASIGEINAIGCFASGLSHDDSHLNQIARIVQQAKVKRGSGKGE